MSETSLTKDLAYYLLNGGIKGRTFVDSRGNKYTPLNNQPDGKESIIITGNPPTVYFKAYFLTLDYTPIPLEKHLKDLEVLSQSLPKSTETEDECDKGRDSQFWRH
ncbi:MAG: hypothetical protein Q7S33_05295 [Nanoarchaeota archaeon]|nr:hypothetical protein [Nanoarchaeota archaeon]